MKRVFFLVCIALSTSLLLPSTAWADETVTVSATSTDISENLNLKTVATLFGQAENLEQFEQMLNNPDSAFSNLDLNGDGDVDYLRVIETADNNRHLVVIQAVLAKDIYQDVASIFVEKDEDSDAVTVQVVGDEYLYGENYIIEPVYIYRPLIYDWFWGSSWVAWHSPYYWGYWPGWWHPYHCIAHHLYWDHCYWFHHYHPICSYRTAHHHRPHYLPMREHVRRNDYATRHPERSFVTRNASRGMVNARALEANRRTAVRAASSATRSTSTRINTASRTTADRTFGSSAVRTSSSNTSRVNAGAAAATRSASSATRTTTTRTSAATPTRTSATTTTRTTTTTPVRSTSTSVRTTTTTPVRSSSTSVRTTTTTPVRSSSTSVRTTTPVRSSSSAVRSASSSSSMRSSSSSAVRSASSSSSMRSSGSYSSGASRSTSTSSSRSGGSRTR